MAIQWTEPGKQVIAGIFAALQDLRPEKLDKELWWAVAFIAYLKLGPDRGAFRDMSVGE